MRNSRGNTNSSNRKGEASSSRPTRARSARQQVSREWNPKVIDLISIVKSLHGLSSLELSGLIRNCESAEDGSSSQINLEDLTKIPIHLMANLVRSDMDEDLIKYFLFGLNVIRKLCVVALQHRKFEKILLDDMSRLYLLFDLIYFMINVLNDYIQDHQSSDHAFLLHSTLVAISLYLLTEVFIPDWAELAAVIVKYPKFEKFVDAIFTAIRMDIEKLQGMLSAQVVLSITEEDAIKHHCQQSEASLQFLQLLCEQKPFLDLLLGHKVLCGKGGVILLAEHILNVNVSTSLPEMRYAAASVSRMKSKALSILVRLCGAERVSYLDKVATTSGSLILAKSIAVKILDLLKPLFSGYDKETLDPNMPNGHLQLNALWLSDALSNDTNFQSYIRIKITGVLSTLLLLPHEEFLSCWCASDPLTWEEDATLKYDPFVAAAQVLDLVQALGPPVRRSIEATLIPCDISRDSYAHKRTTFLIKVIGNLICCTQDINKDEKDLFLTGLSKCLQKKPCKLSNGVVSNSSAKRAAVISTNLGSLRAHAVSLILDYQNDDDMLHLSDFINQLEILINSPEFRMDERQEANPPREESEARNNQDKGKPDDLTPRGLKRINQAAQDVQSNDSAPRFCGVAEIEMPGTSHCTEQPQRKRKTTLMNDHQISVIEKALVDNPDMRKDVASLQSWVEQLSKLGSEITIYQLRNWLINSRTRQARAAKNVHEPSEEAAEAPNVPSSSQVDRQGVVGGSSSRGTGLEQNSGHIVAEPEGVPPRARGQQVMLVNDEGEEVGKGKVHQVDGSWFGINLVELGTWVVDVVKLRCARRVVLPFPCEATGMTFDQAQRKLGVMRVLWAIDRTLVLEH